MFLHTLVRCWNVFLYSCLHTLVVGPFTWKQIAISLEIIVHNKSDIYLHVIFTMGSTFFSRLSKKLYSKSCRGWPPQLPPFGYTIHFICTMIKNSKQKLENETVQLGGFIAYSHLYQASTTIVTPCRVLCRRRAGCTLTGLFKVAGDSDKRAASVFHENAWKCSHLPFLLSLYPMWALV